MPPFKFDILHLPLNPNTHIMSQYHLEQATVTLKPGNQIEITNHAGYKFDLSFSMFENIAEAFNDVCSNIASLAKSVRSQDTVVDDIKAYNLGSIGANERLRLVVRKLNRRIYVSCGIYEEQPNGTYRWSVKKSFRLDYFADDLDHVLAQMKH